MGGSAPSRRRIAAELVLFAVGVVVVTVLNAPSNLFAGPTNGALVDTDGYMRYLRIEELADGGEWFDSVSDRSNYPFGESQHWTRPVDAYVLGLSTLLRPFTGEASLYWSAVINAPLLLLAIGTCLYLGFDMVPRSVRALMMLALLGLLPVTSYASAGRVDHHAAILLVFVLTLISLLRALRAHHPRRAWPLASALVAGLWLSTEFLVPIALVAATIALAAVARQDVDLALLGSRVFFGTALGLLVVLHVERGPAVWSVEHDRVSVVHLAVTIVAAAVFAGFWRGLERLRVNPWALLGGLAAAGGLIVVGIFPDILGGPFVDVDPRVRELWLNTVTELQPAWSVGGWTTLAFLFGPIVIGLFAGGWAISRSEETPSWLSVTFGWLGAYAILTLFQARWAMFAQVLAITLVMYAIQGWYERLGRNRWRILVRPLVIVTLIFGMQFLAIAFDRAEASQAAGSSNCRLEDVIPALRQHDTTTALADQDVGPEILYRTEHRVIATPYHRNESGILFVHGVMRMTDQQQVMTALAQRNVGLILVCPGAGGLLQPAEVDGTFYQALTEGPAPSFVQPLSLPAETDYLLFAVKA